MGEKPETVDISDIVARISKIKLEGSLLLNGEHSVEFDVRRDLILHRKESLPYHPNGMRFTALGASKDILDVKVYYSIGGGFVVKANADGTARIIEDDTPLPFSFSTSKQLLELTEKTGYSISTLMRHNELVRHSSDR